MTAKYDPLRLALESAPSEEPVSFTFTELDELVGGLPASARVHRPWWGNTFSHNRPHAMAWMSLGRRVSEVCLGDAVVFSPADATIEGSDAVRSVPARHVSPQVLDDVSALAAALDRAGYETVLHAVAAHTVFLHPDTVEQTGGKALFRLVRDPTRRGKIGRLSDGRSVMYDDNNGPTLAFLWAAQRAKGRDVQFNHIWGDPRNLETYTALWNLCATPAFLAKTTDGSNHPEVVSLLRYRAFDLFGQFPPGEEKPVRPSGYESLDWLGAPESVDNLEAVLRHRLADAPKSRPAVSARQLGWAFSDGPDETIPEAFA
jgi:hypothetical protein